MAKRSGTFFRFRERVMRDANRVLFPHMAESIQGEHLDDAFGDQKLMDSAPEYKKVIDRGAPQTIVAFSSAALLFAGQPTWEFKAFFDRYGDQYNLVFYRDVHRSCYHITPDKRPVGLAFHEADLRETLADLGTERVVSIGDSGGAAAAIYYGTRLGFDDIIAFSPPFPLRHWISPMAQLRAYTDLPLFLRERDAYWEHVLLACTPLFMFAIPLAWRCGIRNIWDPIRDYKQAEKRPALTIFYGEYNRPETRIIAPIRDLPEVTIRPLPTAKHFCMVKLAKSGELGPTIMGIINEPTP